MTGCEFRAESGLHPGPWLTNVRDTPLFKNFYNALPHWIIIAVGGFLSQLSFTQIIACHFDEFRHFVFCVIVCRQPTSE
jgi:hypothetical protein